MGTILDITEKDRIDQKLRHAKRNAEVASQAKSDRLVNMGHEIRTPMEGVIGMTDLALGMEQDPTQRECLRVVKSTVQSLLVILDDVLDFSKNVSLRRAAHALQFAVRDTGMGIAPDYCNRLTNAMLEATRQ